MKNVDNEREAADCLLRLHSGWHQRFQGVTEFGKSEVSQCHWRHGLLYVGKTNNLATRFGGGHKAFTWAWLDLYSLADIQIVFFPLERWENPALLSEVEAIILRATEPPYNAQIPMES